MERSKGRRQSRTLVARPVASEDIGFPFAAQVAQLARQYEGKEAEFVALITSLQPERLVPRAWLAANRGAWGIETGLHLRLDVSLNDDLCRVRNPNSLWILGMFRRLAVSLFCEWRSRQPNPRHLTLTHFQSQIGAEHYAKAFRFVTCKNPAL